MKHLSLAAIGSAILLAGTAVCGGEQVASASIRTQAPSVAPRIRYDAPLNMKKVPFEGWHNCIEITSGDFRIIVTTDIGPRIIGGFIGKNPHNIFFVDPALAGKTGGDKWVNYGGHRMWHSPERLLRSAVPDNLPIQMVKTGKNGLSFIGKDPVHIGFTRTLNIYPMGKNMFRVEHVLQNDGIWPIECAPWAISVMAPGGTAIVPQNTDPSGRLPTKFVAVWPYTSMADKRITWGDRFVMVRQDPTPGVQEMKIGLNCKNGWIAYVNNGIAFVKSVKYLAGKKYPDNNCNVEVYACDQMLEAETLGPLNILQPGEKSVHVEEWDIFEISEKIKTEQDIVHVLGLDEYGLFK